MKQYIFMGAFIGLCASLLFASMFLVGVGPAEGSHQGYITAVEKAGFLFPTYSAYIKTDLSSSQEDKYCVSDPAVIDKLKAASVEKRSVSVAFSNPLFVWVWECKSGDASIIRSVQ